MIWQPGVNVESGSPEDDPSRREGFSSRISGEGFAFPKGGQMMLGHHAINLCPPACPKTRPMKNDPILSQIAEYCRQADMAETTFGPPAPNAGNLVHRPPG